MYSDPVVAAPNASPSTAETGAAITFTASPSGGSGGYSYGWNGLPTPCSGTGTAAPVCHPASAGVYSVSVAVTDSNGYLVTSAPLSYTVEVGPAVTVPTATPTGPIDFGGSVNFSTVASGGVGPYALTWQNLPMGCLSVNASTINCVPSTSGSWPVRSR